MVGSSNKTYVQDREFSLEFLRHFEQSLDYTGINFRPLLRLLLFFWLSFSIGPNDISLDLLIGAVAAQPAILAFHIPQWPSTTGYHKAHVLKGVPSIPVGIVWPSSLSPREEGVQLPIPSNKSQRATQKVTAPLP